MLYSVQHTNLSLQTRQTADMPFNDVLLSYSFLTTAWHSVGDIGLSINFMCFFFVFFRNKSLTPDYDQTERYEYFFHVFILFYRLNSLFHAFTDKSEIVIDAIT